MSQTTQILQALERGETLTPIDALNRFGCFRLGARVYDLRKMGYNIINLGDEKYARYKLDEKKPPGQESQREIPAVVSEEVCGASQETSQGARQLDMSALWQRR